MSITIVTPSLNRAELLEHCKSSVRKYAPGIKHIVSIQTEARPLPVVLNELFRDAFADPDCHAVVVLSDHCRVLSGFGEGIKRAFGSGTDHMQGIRIQNLDWVENLREFCFFGIGREFYERFPDGQVCCPEYWHFSFDTELGLAAKKLGKFKMDHSVMVAIMHPNARNAPADDTYRASRSQAAYDKETRGMRDALGLLWGVTFDKVRDAKPWDAPVVVPVADVDHDSPGLTRKQRKNQVEQSPANEPFPLPESEPEAEPEPITEPSED
jgi:hypothetical protein